MAALRERVRARTFSPTPPSNPPIWKVPSQWLQVGSRRRDERKTDPRDDLSGVHRGNAGLHVRLRHSDGTYDRSCLETGAARASLWIPAGPCRQIPHLRAVRGRHLVGERFCHRPLLHSPKRAGRLPPDFGGPNGPAISLALRTLPDFRLASAAYPVQLAFTLRARPEPLCFGRCRNFALES